MTKKEFNNWIENCDIDKDGKYTSLLSTDCLYKFYKEAQTEQLKHHYQIKINKIMSYKLNTQDENPLWRNYMDNVNNDEQWMKEVKLNTPFPSKNFAVYSEDEFLEKLKSDEEFNKKWGTIKAPLSN